MRQRSSSQLFLVTRVGFALTVILSGIAGAAPVVITFEEIPNAGAALSQYAAQGVTFNQPRVRDYSLDDTLPAGFAHSGTKGIEHCFALEFCTTPIEASFTAPQRRVKAWIGYSSRNFVDLTAVMTAFNAQGQQVGQATVPYPPRDTPRPIQTPIQVVAQSRSIVRVALHMTGGNPPTVTNSFAVDDLEFDTEGPPPVCNATLPPALTLQSPQSGSSSQMGSFLFGGSLTTQTPLIEATLTVTGAGGASYTSDLLGSGFFPLNSGTFGPTRFSPLFPGSNQIVVRIANCRDARQITRTVTYDPIPPGTRFVLDHIEVTQATQELDNLGNNVVELIAEKRTIARVYLRTTGPAAGTINGVSGTLFASGPDGEAPGGPTTVRSLNSIAVGPDPALGPRRSSLDRSLNFELPPEWTVEGGLHLQLTSIQIDGNPNPLLCNNCDNRNEFNLRRIVRFRSAPPLRVVLWTVPYTSGGVTHEPRTLDLDLLESWLRRAYPTARVLASRQRLSPLSGIPDTDFDCDDVNYRLAQLRTLCINIGFSSVCFDTAGRQVHWYGMVSDTVDFMRGCARGIPGTVACGPSGTDTWGWDFDGSYADWYGGHELAHSYDRRHPGFCNNNSDDDDDFPYAGGIIGQVGFDVGDLGLSVPMQVYPGGRWHDVMTYCDEQWMSDYTYLGILDCMRDIEGSGGGGGVLASALLVQGDINLTRNLVQLRPFLRLPGLMESERPAASPFAVELRNAAGAVIAKYPFDPAEHSETEVGEDLLASFDLVVPWVDGARRIAVMNGARELASQSVSPNAPQVRIVTPNGPIVTPANGILPVRWQGSDADGDPLTYTILYSPDGGQHWEPVDAGLTATQRDVPIAAIRGSDQVLFRVIASDGVNTAVDDQDAPMQVSRKSPVPRIIAPRNGHQVASDTALVLRGEAFDLEDGHLEGESLVWSLDGARRLGAGTSISASGLPPGAHRITLQATDSDGATANASVSVEVTAVPAIATVEADSPVVPGTEVRLDGSASSGHGRLSFEWELLDKPANSVAAIAGAKSAIAAIRPDLAGTYKIELRVRDLAGQGSVAAVTVQAANGIRFLRGEVTGDGQIDISDPVRVLGWLFLGDGEPPCVDAADANDDGIPDISDVVQVLSYLFLGGSEPSRPFPDCGLDPTGDGLGCRREGCR